MSEGGREQIIQEQKDIPVENIVEAIKDARLIMSGVSDTIAFAKKVEQESQNMTAEEKVIFIQFLKEINENNSINLGSSSVVPVVVGIWEGGLLTAAACARTPACASAVVNLLGAAGTAILSAGSEKKVAAPKPVPSTSGNSATGGPNGEEDPEQYKKPNEKLTANDKIDVGKFSVRTKLNGNTVYKDPKSNYFISKDIAGARGHGGSYWKLLDKNGNRIGTLTKDGKFLRN